MTPKKYGYTKKHISLMNEEQRRPFNCRSSTVPGDDNDGNVGASSAGEEDSGLAPTYSTPREASAAYQSGLLKSDPKISSNHEKIRMAIRYLLKEEATESHLQGGPPTDDEDLFLCWINAAGIPHHFRRMRPYRNATLFVNRNDRIENTFPGHAFVFCRRVEYGHSDTIAEGHGNDPIVVCDNGMTYFLRRVKNSDNKEVDSVWEKYLVVGGYRPVPMPKTMKDKDDNSGADDTVVESDGGERSLKGKKEESDDNSKADDSVVESDGGKRSFEGKAEESDDESDDDSHDEEHLLQLVTIQYVRKNPNTNGKRELETKGNDTPSKDLCCSNNFFQAVPFLRDMMSAKTRRAPAFVATTTDDSAPLKSPPHDNNHFFDDAALTISACVSILDSTPLDTTAKHYDEVILGGWPCRIEPGCFPSDMALPKNGRNLLRLRFELDLMAASLSLPPEARAKLKKCTPIWINKSQSYGPKLSPIIARDACFHPGSGWLKKNGMSPAKCGGVEFFDARHYLSDCDLWGAGGLILHELSHAWHSKFVEDGYDNKEIIDVYNKAMEDGLYDCVRVHGPQGPRCKAYACENQMEYFAELSVAFLGGLDEEEHNKWYPFNRSQIKEHDPRAYAMLGRIWGIEGNM
ncbi:hypothetical protein ACHAW5_011095 [Stephanodiscus triporus]|uniref:Lysine-specific metallo-endopeptidase domain-containing protein n=1 Tax=Stephanodiscus triporus TaxID=2934178 RepID=A0ABD3QL48_9STRA